MKRGLNVDKKAFLTVQVSTIIQCKTLVKYKDPGCLTISMNIGGTYVEKALLDLGAIVNLLPYSVYKELGLRELKPTSITLSLADRSIKIPKGIVEDVLIQVDKFYYPVDFVLLDIEPVAVGANYVPIILGRPFLATSNAIINCQNGVMQLTFGNMTLELNIFHLSKKHMQPAEEGPEEICIIDTILEEQADQQQRQDVLTEELFDCPEEQQETHGMNIVQRHWRKKEEILPLLTGGEANKPKKLDLKPIPLELKYAYLEEHEQCPVVIFSLLSNHQENNLLDILKENKQAIGWKITYLKGISLTVCTHHVYLEEEEKLVRQPPRRLNPHMQEVVCAEVLKLLQDGIIYPISDSTWVSPTQVVPKKSGVTTMHNEKGEEVIRRPYFYYNPIPGNADCSAKDLHNEVYYDLPAFAEDPEVRDSMRSVQRYSLEQFMTPRRFYYPRVVIEFYHTMTSRREPNSTTIHFTIDGRPRILRATDIAATFNLPVVLANSVDYRQWPHPSTMEMVRLLSRDTTTKSILFRRLLPQSTLLIDHVLQSNIFPLQHIVQRRGVILEALYRISEGFWFSPTELIMTSLFHFEDKVHRRNLIRAESTPLIFLRLLCQVLEHIGFPTELRLEHCRDREAVLIVDRWQTRPRSFHLPPSEIAEDQPGADLLPEDQPGADLLPEEQPPPIVHPEEPQVPASSVPAPTTTAPLPTSLASSAPPDPLAPNTTTHAYCFGPSTTTPSLQYISISTRDFLVIMDAVHTLSAMSASFAIAHAALAERMTHTKVAMAKN